MSSDRLLVVCTANICRSPMGEALLRSEAESRSVAAEITSAGVRARHGYPAADGSMVALAPAGHDLSAHRSRPADADVVDAADLVIAMEVRHVLDMVRGDPARLARAFTLRELVGRAGAVGPRGERPIADWLAEVGEGRTAADLARAVDLDVVDPYGGPQAGYHACAADLVTLTGALARSLWGPVAGRAEGPRG